MSTHLRHPANVEGLFYTTACLACGAPEAEAPELFAPLEGGNFDTYFVRQPSTHEEIERACRAIRVCCVNAVRYSGDDPHILARLGDSPDWCDRPRAWWRRLLPD